jgi:hypothetical protein
MSREDALQRLSLLGELIDPNPENKAAFSTDEIAEFQKILTDGNYTVRQLMREVGRAAMYLALASKSIRFTVLSERK